jgi:hypothetical protein
MVKVELIDLSFLNEGRGFEWAGEPLAAPSTPSYGFAEH